MLSANSSNPNSGSTSDFEVQVDMLLKPPTDPSLGALWVSGLGRGEHAFLYSTSFESCRSLPPSFFTPQAPPSSGYAFHHHLKSPIDYWCCGTPFVTERPYRASPPYIGLRDVNLYKVNALDELGGVKEFEERDLLLCVTRCCLPGSGRFYRDEGRVAFFGGGAAGGGEAPAAVPIARA